jgi:hypothetical protein
MLGVILALAAVVVQASSRSDVEASAIVNGTLVVAQDGTVQAVVVDEPEKYGQPIVDLVRKAVLQWRFQPVLRHGAPVAAKSTMHVRVVLGKKPDGNYTARIKGASFGDSDAPSTDAVRRAEINRKFPPKYPEAAIRGRVQGTVYLALRLDRGGRVVDAVAEQVNLGNLGPGPLLKHFRAVLADSALKAARQWRFEIPTTGPLAAQESWTVHVPVNYALNDHNAPPRNTTWVSYVPGPYTPAPWVHKPDLNAADALADGSVRTDGAGPVLLSTLDHG